MHVGMNTSVRKCNNILVHNVNNISFADVSHYTLLVCIYEQSKKPISL